VQRRLQSLGLSDIAAKLDAGERLSLDEGVRLFQSPDLHAVGWLANRERERRHESRTYYNFNLRLEATNVCEASCLFCSFARLRRATRRPTRCRSSRCSTSCARADQPLTEVHRRQRPASGSAAVATTDMLRA
jgi:aminodeoxyfutalosine synthase